MLVDFPFPLAFIIDIFNYRVNEGRAIAMQRCKEDISTQKRVNNLVDRYFKATSSYRKNVPAFKATGGRSPLMRLFNDSIDVDDVSRN